MKIPIINEEEALSLLEQMIREYGPDKVSEYVKAISDKIAESSKERIHDTNFGGKQSSTPYNALQLQHLSKEEELKKNNIEVIYNLDPITLK